MKTILRKFGDKYPDQAFIICSGLDMVNLNYCHVVCPDVATANGKKSAILGMVWHSGMCTTLEYMDDILSIHCVFLLLQSKYVVYTIHFIIKLFIRLFKIIT